MATRRRAASRRRCGSGTGPARPPTAGSAKCRTSRSTHVRPGPVVGVEDHHDLARSTSQRRVQRAGLAAAGPGRPVQARAAAVRRARAGRGARRCGRRAVVDERPAGAGRRVVERREARHERLDGRFLVLAGHQHGDGRPVPGVDERGGPGRPAPSASPTTAKAKWRTKNAMNTSWRARPTAHHQAVHPHRPGARGRGPDQHHHGPWSARHVGLACAEPQGELTPPLLCFPAFGLSYASAQPLCAASVHADETNDDAIYVAVPRRRTSMAIRPIPISTPSATPPIPAAGMEVVPLTNASPAVNVFGRFCTVSFATRCAHLQIVAGHRKPDHDVVALLPVDADVLTGKEAAAADHLDGVLCVLPSPGPVFPVEVSGREHRGLLRLVGDRDRGGDLDRSGSRPRTSPPSGRPRPVFVTFSEVFALAGRAHVSAATVTSAATMWALALNPPPIKLPPRRRSCIARNRIRAPRRGRCRRCRPPGSASPAHELVGAVELLVRATDERQLRDQIGRVDAARHRDLNYHVVALGTSRGDALAHDEAPGVEHGDVRLALLAPAAQVVLGVEVGGLDDGVLPGRVVDRDRGRDLVGLVPGRTPANRRGTGDRVGHVHGRECEGRQRQHQGCGECQSRHRAEPANHHDLSSTA